MMSFALGILLAGCQADPYDWRDDSDWKWEGEHVTVHGYGRSEEEVCGGSFEALEAHSASIAEFFGYDGDLHYDYLWLSEEVFEGKCRPGAGACTAAGVPWTRSIPDMHEAAHAVMARGQEHSCASLLEEGIASYFGTPQFHSFWESTTGDYVPWIGDVLTAAPLAYDDYERAGNFVSFLIEEFGPEAVVSLCDAVPYSNSLDDWRAATPAVLGVELPALLAAYEEYPRCHGQQYRARLWECSGSSDVMASPDQDTVFEIEMSCADERVIGPVGNRIVATRRIEFAEEITADVTLRDSMGQELALDFNLQQCAACSELPHVYAKSDVFPAFWFDAGVYELLIFADLDFDETISVHVEPM